MNSFLVRSNSSHLPSRPKPDRPKPPSGMPTTGRPTTPGPSSTFSGNTKRPDPASPTDSSRPARPKSTLGFSSKFALSWKNSLKSSTSARCGTSRPGDESAGNTPVRHGRQAGAPEASRLVRDGGGRGGGGGGMKGLRRKVSMEWWGAPAGTRPSTPATSLAATPVRREGGRGQQQPRPRSWAMSPRTPLSAAATTSNTPTRASTPVAATLVPLARKAEPESPPTKAVHAEFRAAARELEGDWKECLLGAVFVRIIDPLEGIKEEYMKEFAPLFRSPIKLVSPTSSHHPTRPGSAMSTKSPIPWGKSRPLSATPTLTPRSRTLAPSKARSPIPSAPASPTPASRVIRPTISPTPLTRRPLVSRRTVDAPPLLTASASSATRSPKSSTTTAATAPSAAMTLRHASSVSGVTPRSARRMRNSLKMTPLPSAAITGSRLPLPVAYVPLKGPAPSPRSSLAPARQGSATPPARGASRPSTPGTASSTPRSGLRASTGIPPTSGPSTPAKCGKAVEEEVMSPWQVVRPSPAFARRHEGVAADTDWVLASPLRRSLR